MEDLGLDKKLKISTYRDVKCLCREAAKKVDMEIDKSATNLIAELVWKQAKVIARDVEMFAKHAKRTTINADDIKLIARHNEKLMEELSKMAGEPKKRKSKKAEPESSNFVEVL